MKRNIIILLILFTVIHYEVIAQNQKEIDKLKQLLLTHQTDTDKVNTLNQLGFHYRQTDKIIAIKYLNESILLSKKINYKYGLCGAYNRMGLVYKNSKKYDAAEKYYNMSLSIAIEIKDSVKIADVYNNLGNVYRLTGQHTNAIKSFIKALALREAINDTSGIAAAYSNLSFIYSDKKNYSKAIESNQKAIYYYTLANDSFELARSYGQSGYIYYYQDSFSRALEFDKKALLIYEKLGDRYETAVTLNNIGNILTEMGMAEKSLPYLMKAGDISISIKDSNGIFVNKLSIAQTYNSLENYPEALKNCEYAISILKKSGGIVNMYIDAYQLLADILKNKGDYNKALNAYITYDSYRDSLIKQTNNETITELEEKYESDKKDLIIRKRELEIDLIKYKLNKRNYFLAVLTLIILLVIIIAYQYYSRLKLKKEKELHEEIIKQQQIRSKAVLEAEEKERNRIAKDLHDGLGQQLSAIKLLIQSEKQYPEEQTDKKSQENITKLIDDAITEVRVISHSMMPNALLKHGLIIAVREFVHNVTSSGTLKIDLQIVGLNERLEPSIEIAIYRILQELVNNTIKHAKADTISIQFVNHNDGNLNIIFEDNGIGYDTQSESSMGMGLRNIQSRIQYLNGKIEFDSYRGRGTTVIVDIPI